MIARVASLRQRIALGFAFEIGAGHVVEQQIVIQIEQLAQLMPQMFFQLLLVRQQGV